MKHYGSLRLSQLVLVFEQMLDTSGLNILCAVLNWVHTEDCASFEMASHVLLVMETPMSCSLGHSVLIPSGHSIDQLSQVPVVHGVRFLACRTITAPQNNKAHLFTFI